MRARGRAACASSTSQSATHSAPSREQRAEVGMVPCPPHPIMPTRTRRLAPATRSWDAAVDALTRAARRSLRRRGYAGRGFLQE